MIIPALDLASRLHLGQIKEVANYCNNRTNLRKTDFYEGMNALLQFKKLVLPEEFGPGTSYGIHSESVSDEARALYDILQVLRNRLAWDNLPEEHDSMSTMFVDFDTPFQYSDKHELPEIEKL